MVSCLKGVTMGYLAQDLLIENLNEEFKKYQLPSQFRLDEEGVCNGLAMVYTQYALQGSEKEAEFFKILNLIAQGQMNSEVEHGLQEGTILFFASQVLLAFKPSRYDLSQNQSTAMEMLKINGRPLISSFDFALAARDKVWAEIIANLDLQDDEVMVVQSINHAVSVRKINNRYRVYDPNYSTGAKEFTTERELIHELHTDVFGYARGNLGLELHIVRHPEALPRKTPFPALLDLYQRYPPSGKDIATINSKQFDTLIVAAGAIKDAQVIEALIKLKAPNAAEIFEAAKQAIIANNTTALGPLLQKMEAQESISSKQFKVLLQLAVAAGRLAVYQDLEKYLPLSHQGTDPCSLVLLAASGGNPEILRKVLQEIKALQKSYLDTVVNQYMAKADFVSLGRGEEEDKQVYLSHFIKKSTTNALFKAMDRAISKGNTECIKLLLNELSSYNQCLHEKQMLDYLLIAIGHNQVYALQTLINANPEMSEKVLKHISMSALSVKQTELEVLKELKNNGMHFSSEAEEIIQIKIKDKYLSLRTILNLVIDYIQNFFGKKQITYDEIQLISLKKAECKQSIQKLEAQLPALHENDSELHVQLAEFVQSQKLNLEKAQDFTAIIEINESVKAKMEIAAYYQHEVISLDGFVFESDDSNVDIDEPALEVIPEQMVDEKPEYENQKDTTSKFKAYLEEMKEEAASEHDKTPAFFRT